MIKLKSSLLTLAMLLCSLAASAHDFEVDGIYYDITSSGDFGDLTVEVTYRGSSSSSYNEYSGSVVIPEKVTYNSKEYSVTRIGYSAFEGCSGLTSVTIPNSVTSIWISAFEGCSGLKSVTIGNSVTSIWNSAFEGCSSLTSVTIPNSVTSIESSAFSGCSGLKSVTIGNSVTSIGDRAFLGCSGLASVDIPNSVTSIGNYAFSGCSGLKSVTIGNSVTSIGYSAFSDCSGLTSVDIPNSVTSIESYAFSGCSGLKSVTIGNSVTTIWNSAFERCSGLASIKVESGNTKYDSRDNCNAIIETNTNTLIIGCTNTLIPNSVTSIGDCAFSDCSGLTSVTIPNSVTRIGDSAFRDCSGLTSVTIPNSVTSIGYSAFRDCSGLTSVTIPNSVTRIGDCAFFGCSGLTSVTIPNSVTSIGSEAFSGTGWYDNQSDGVLYLDNWLIDYKGTMPANTSITINEGTRGIADIAFYCCSGLVSVSIPNSVTSIGGSAFSGCSGLTSVTIGNSVTSIGSYAFYGCSGLTSVAIPNSVTSIGGSAFSGCSGLKSVTIPNSVTSIGSEAFSGTGWYNNQSDGVLYLDNWLIDYKGTRPANTSITIKEGTRGIADSAFYGCGLTSITIPNSVTSIGDYAFGNKGLTAVHISDLSAWCKIKFNGIMSGSPYHLYLNGEEITNLVIPDGITSIGNNVFARCGYLTSVTIPNSVTSIGIQAFYCSGLTSVTIPNSVTSIGDVAFIGCTGLMSVTIPSSVTSIGEAAFMHCTGLTSVTVEHDVPLSIYYSTFAFEEPDENYNLSFVPNNAILRVPYGSKAAYASSSGWKSFSRIEEMPIAQFVIPEMTVYPSKTFVLPIEMNNAAELTAFQCDIYIPEGITLQKNNKGKYDITLDSERSDDHTISAALQPDGSVRVVAVSMTSAPLFGTEGPLFHLNLLAGEELGIYTIDVKNISVSDVAGNLYNLPDVSGTVEVYYKPGDANGDGSVAVNDAVLAVNKILGAESEEFKFRAADMNGDGNILVNDVVLIVNTILGVNPTTAALAPRHMNAFETLSVTDNRTAYGMTEFGITLSNASHYTAMQFDMELAEGADIVDIKVSMPTDHSVAYRRIDDTTVRVVVTSLTNEALAEGAQLCISMKDAAGKTIAFTNGRAAYNNGQMVGIMPGSTVLGGTTGIDGINVGFAPADVYSIDGRIVKKNATTLDGLKPGVYVVNGRKVVVEK